ncbi:basic blue protein-like [Herrania umbratica]|uniref:Basic blue protein n=1 Tax=Herrania umbratica TaxID=108875 RepID=A0A6J1AKK2_9ROSI|nr:basic blue protein-like [Herrania umbratica]
MKMAIISSSILVPAILVLMLQYEAIHSASTTYIVGDEEGWDLSIDLEGWTKGKDFHAGDILDFIYDRVLFNVVVVNQTGHDTCTVNDGATEFTSGDDKIPLAFGANYFICSKEPGACAGGMKMAINATAPPPPPSK